MRVYHEIQVDFGLSRISTDGIRVYDASCVQIKADRPTCYSNIKKISVTVFYGDCKDEYEYLANEYIADDDSCNDLYYDLFRSIKEGDDIDISKFEYLRTTKIID